MCIHSYALMDSPFDRSSGHGSAFGASLPVCAIHAGHDLLPGRSPAQQQKKNRFACQP